MILQTQNGWKEYNLCGEASEAMLVNAVNGTQLNARDVAPEIEGRGKGETTSIPQLVNSMRDDYGVYTLAKPASLLTVRSEFAAGRPMIALIIRGYIPEWKRIYAKDQWGYHFVVLENPWKIYDPLSNRGGLGDGLPVTPANLQLALRGLIVLDPLHLDLSLRLTAAQLDQARRARALLATLPLE